MTNSQMISLWKKLDEWSKENKDRAGSFDKPIYHDYGNNERPELLDKVDGALTRITNSIYNKKTDDNGNPRSPAEVDSTY